MSRSGIVNVRMVITEEKILSNIDKVQKLINPNSKKQIVELEEDSYFKDLVESIKTYLIEYPKKKNFPVGIYKATYGLVEFATIQFEENTKKIEKLIKQREENIALSSVLKEIVESVNNKEEGWKEKVESVSEKFDEDIIENLNIVGNSKTNESQAYTDAMKILNAIVSNLESHIHREIDMERLEDSSKALSYIGIEVADALKLIPAPEEQLEAIAEQNAIDEMAKETETNERFVVAEENVLNAKEEKDETLESLIDETLSKTEDTIIQEQQQYTKETTFEAKPSLWQRFKNSKFIKAATYVFRIKVKIELPSNALPEGRGENV